MPWHMLQAKSGQWFRLTSSLALNMFRAGFSATNQILDGYIISYNWLVVSKIFYFPFHIWDVIPTPLTNSDFSRWLLHHQPVIQLTSGTKTLFFRMSHVQVAGLLRCSSILLGSFLRTILTKQLGFLKLPLEKP